MPPLELQVGFDGSSPHSPEGVTRLGAAAFEVRPSWRAAPGVSEEAPGAGVRFWVRARNPGTATAPLDLFVNWEDPSDWRLALRDWVAVRRPGGDWEQVAAPVERRGVRVRLDLPPGTTDLAASPERGVGETMALLAARAAASPLARLASAGKSAEGRDLPVLLVDDPAGAPAKSDFVLFGRNHPYETASDWCVDGMLDFLLGGGPAARAARAGVRFHFLPLTNPDGVFHGLSRLTAPRGADLNRIREQDDAAWRSLRAYLDLVRPRFFLNLHNWMSKTQDGLLANTREFAEAFRRRMSDLREDGKEWMVEWTEKFLEREKIEDYRPGSPDFAKHASWKNDLHARHGTAALVLEFPWRGRTPARMREIGRQALLAFLDTAGEVRAG
jgi:hypothetical protein